MSGYWSHTIVRAVAVVGALVAASPADAEELRFNRDVRPILSDKCFACHGPDASSREAELRLDDAESATEDRGGYAAVVPGEPEESEALRRILAEDEYERMPPPETGKELSEEEIAVLRRWIEDGAEYEPHWSYAPLAAPEVPGAAGEFAAWRESPSDAFIARRWTEQGAAPVADVDPTTLARRLHFDLSGLPPLMQDVEAFVDDENPDAQIRLTDRLLASPCYGERMAIWWLDLVRYADTVGYHGDQGHHASLYRDYVIDAFNRNLSFDRFTLEQLAGDLLPSPTDEQLIATCYNRLLQTTHEGGAQDKEYLAKYAADRVRNLGETWLGASTGCAECHDHKYDPILQADFYSLQAFFADVQEQGAFNSPNALVTTRPPEREFLPARYRGRLAELEQQISGLEEALESAKKSKDSLARLLATEEPAIRLQLLNEQRDELLKKTPPGDDHGQRAAADDSPAAARRLDGRQRTENAARRTGSFRRLAGSRRSTYATRSGRVAGRRPTTRHAPGVGESTLGAVVRKRIKPHADRRRRTGRTADAYRVARLSGR